MTRREFPQSVKRDAAFRAGGKCECCGLKIIGRPEYDHVLPDGLTGDPTLENCQVLCSKCHTIKTKQDKARMAKADSIRRGNEGRKRRKGRPLPGNKDSDWKHTLSGEWIRR